MRISEHRKQEIVAAFQRSFKRDNSEEIEPFSLQDLRQVDEMLGDRDINSGFRLALRNRIKDLETAGQRSEQRSHESKVRAWTFVVGIVTGLVISGLAKLIFG